MSNKIAIIFFTVSIHCSILVKLGKTIIVYISAIKRNGIVVKVSPNKGMKQSAKVVYRPVRLLPFPKHKLRVVLKVPKFESMSTVNQFAGRVSATLVGGVEEEDFGYAGFTRTEMS